jgi:TP901 family phage tail tape measure protein
VSDYNLGTATGTIRIRYDGGGADDAQGALGRLGGSANSASAAVTDVGNKAGIAGVAIFAGLAVAANSAAEFEKRLSAIKAVSGNTADEMEKVRTKALAIGKDTAFSAVEAAMAMEELSKAGIKTEDILNGAADATVALAAAGEIDLPLAATIASNAMNQFQLKAADLPRVADLLAGAANASAISVQDLGESLNYVGPVANALGVSIDDVSAALGILGNQGIKGSSAGTALRSIMTNLSPSTNKATEAFKELGLITKDGSNQFFTATGKLKPLNEVVGILNGSLKGLTAEQKNAFAKKAFGLESLAAVSILAGTTSSKFDEMTASIAKVKAADVAKTRLDNVKGAMDGLKGSAETLAIQLGSIMLPAIRKIVDGLNTILGTFLALSPGMQKFIVVTAATVAGILLAIAVVIKVTAAVQTFRATMIALNLVMAANPVVFIVAAIVILIAILVVAYRNSETFRNAFSGTWQQIKAVLLPIVAQLKVALSEFFATMVVVGRAALSVLQVLWKIFGGVIMAIVMGFVNGVINVVKGFIKILTGIFQLIRGILTGDWKLMWTGLKNIVMGAIQFIWGLINVSFFGRIIKGFSVGLRAMRSLWAGGLAGIRAVAASVMAFVRSLIANAMNVIVTLFRSGPAAAMAAFRAALNAGLAAARSFATRIITVIRSIPTMIRNAFSNAGSILTGAGRAIITGLLNGINSMISYVREKLNYLTNLIPDWKGPMSKDKELLVKNGRAILGSLMTGFDKHIPVLKKYLKGFTTDIPGFVTAPRSLDGPANAVTAVPKRTAAGISQIPAARTYNTTINNPLPERSGESVNKRLSTITLAGI